MPTGGGKSLCYQLPSLLLPGISIIISPLIALMIDQVNSLKEKKICCGYLSSSQTMKEKKEVLSLINNSPEKIKMLYVSPEKFDMDDFKQIIFKLNQKNFISFFAVDEAHCISKYYFI